MTVRAGDPDVIYGEGRAEAWLGVVLESLILAAVLLLALLVLRCATAVLSARWRTGPGQRRRVEPGPPDAGPRGRENKNPKLRLVGAGDPRGMLVSPVPRRDGIRLQEGDEVEVVSLRRSLLRHRAVGPYALRRPADRQVFLAGGPALHAPPGARV